MGHVYRFDIFSLDPPRREAYKFAAGAFRGGVSRKVQGMPRVARVVIVDVAHHVTQRGNGRQFILASDTERLVYLDLLHQALREQPLSVLGYCLMSNHVHLVAVPRQAEVLAGLSNRCMGVTPRIGTCRTRPAGMRGRGGFIPAPWTRPFVDGAALCGTESRARRDGGGGGGVAVVERRRALRNG